MTIWTEIADILEVNTKLSTSKREAAAKRIAGSRLFDLGVACSRCGGTGHFSYNHQDGTICYGCSGVGKLPPKGTKALVVKLKELKEAGVVSDYWAGRRAVTAMKKIDSGIFDTWEVSGIAEAYKTHCSHGNDRGFSFEAGKAYSSWFVGSKLFALNNKFCKLLEEASILSRPVTSLKGTLNTDEKAALALEVTKTIDTKLAELLTEAFAYLANPEDFDAKVQEFKEEYPNC